jgi:hypothetical protein
MEACETHKWPDDVKACAAGIDRKDEAGAKACVDKLDADTKAKSVADIDKAAAANGSTATW